MDDVAGRCAEDVSRTVRGVFAAILPSEETYAVLMSLVTRRIGDALAGRAERPPACRRGCATCCTINVGTLAVEGAAIAGFLRRRLGPDQVRELARRLTAFHDRVRWLDDGERIREGLSCPFLDDASACSIHPVRPLACRAVSSLDAEDCRRAIAARGDDDEGGGAVRMDLLQRAVHESALGSLAAALATRGLDSRRRDVSGMAGVFLADARLAAAYGRGRPVPLE